MRVAIIGLGMIGGSIALALKKSKVKGLQVIGIPRREETLKEALKAGAIDEGTTDYKKGVAGADVVFICTPINLVLPIIRQIAPYLKKGAIVSDVGSSKADIVGQAEKILAKRAFFIGGHPMAGKETVKFAAAEPGLFQGRVWILTKTTKTDARALAAVSRLAGLMGARVIKIDPQTHDLVVAAVSHMPLAVAAALVNTIAGEGKKELMAKIAASGFRDTTRIASGDPLLGLDMFISNKKAVLKMISAFKKALTNLEREIIEGKREKIRATLTKAKKLRDHIYG